MSVTVRRGVFLSPRPACLAVLTLAVLLTQTVGHAASTALSTDIDPLAYSKGYLLTGNYAVGGVDVTSASASRGFVTGTISMSRAVPANADILAAFLYWETVSASDAQVNGVKFRGQPLVAVKTTSKSVGKNAACFSSGSNLTLTEFRADVLRLLPPQLDGNMQPTGKRLVNDEDLAANGFGPHTVTLPQANGNLAPESAGASLVVIYRDPSPTAPLRKITIYEGAYVQAQNASLVQHIRGFYQASASPDAYLTQIVSAGAKNKTAALSFNNVPLWSSAFQAASSQDDRTWFTRTDNVGALLRYDTTNPADKFGETATVTLSHGNSNPYECLTWSAMIFSTTVADTDGDGLPDGIEAATGGLKDPDGTPLPNLNAMGARVGQKDVFVEINAMKTDVPQTYGGVQAPPHNHMPSASVLNSVGDALLSAGVKVHFDVGPALGLSFFNEAATSE